MTSNHHAPYEQGYTRPDYANIEQDGKLEQVDPAYDPAVLSFSHNGLSPLAASFPDTYTHLSDG